MLIGLIVTPRIMGALGENYYGIWILMAAVLGYYGLLDLGISSAIVRYAARYTGQKDRESLNRTANTAMILFTFIGLVALVLSFVLAEVIVRFFNINPGDWLMVKRCIWLLGITTALLFPANVMSVLMIAHERFVIRNTEGVVTAVFRACLYLVSLHYGWGLIGLCWVNLVIGTTTFVINVLIMRLFFRHIKMWTKSFFDYSMIWAFLSFGFFTSIIQIGRLFKNKIGALVIGRCLDMNSVAVYGVAELLSGYLLSFVIAFSGVFQPRLAALAGQQDGEAFGKTIKRYSVLVSNLSVCGGVLAFLLCRDFLTIWLPKDFSNPQIAAVIFTILLVGLIPELVMGVMLNALLAVDKHKYYAYQTLAEGVASIVMSIVFVKKFGIYGAALGVVLPAVVARAIIQPVYCCKVFHIRWSQYMGEVMLKPLLLAVAVIIFFRITGIMYEVDSYPELLLKGMLISVAYLGASFFFCIGNSERRALIPEPVWQWLEV